jgi:hypothetical protein
MLLGTLGAKSRKVYALVALAAAVCCGAVVGTRGCRNTHVRAGGGEEDFAFHISPKGDAIVFSANSSGGKDIYLFDPKLHR